MLHFIITLYKSIERIFLCVCEFFDVLIQIVDVLSLNTYANIRVKINQ